MGFRLRPCDVIVDSAGMPLYFLRQVQPSDQFCDMPRRRMVMVPVMMVSVVTTVSFCVSVPGPRLLLFLSMHGHRHVDSGDPTGLPRLRLKLYPGQSQSIHRIQKAFLILQQLIQSGHEHISCRSHITLNI